MRRCNKEREWKEDEIDGEYQPVPLLVSIEYYINKPRADDEAELKG